MKGLRIRVEGCQFEAEGLGFRVSGLGSKVYGSGFRAKKARSGLGLAWISNLQYMIEGLFQGIKIRKPIEHVI